MDRQSALRSAADHFGSGAFRADLTRKVAYRTDSRDPGQEAAIRAYLSDELMPQLARLGFTARIVENPASARLPFVIAHRTEGESRPTLLTYGHGDVQPAHAEQWRSGLEPWTLTVDGDRWYGRGVADNKGQHAINLAALEHVLNARRGRLGFNVTLLLDMGEESGSPGLREICERYRDELAADLFVASDGPRLHETTPTVFLGARGGVNFTLRLHERDRSYHSGNWGGLLRNPATVVANAIACLVDGRGRLLVDGLRPDEIPPPVREALRDIEVGADPGPSPDDGWGEPDLSAAERVFAWNTVEVLAMGSGDVEDPVNAIPAAAVAHCQLRFVVGIDPSTIETKLRSHLDANGFDLVELDVGHRMDATRLDPADPWVEWTMTSLGGTTGVAPALLPNLGGSLPNAAFADTLGLPTVWIPHSYPGCAQHAPNEHLPASLVRESLEVMTGLFWDLGELDQWPPSAGVPSHGTEVSAR